MTTNNPELAVATLAPPSARWLFVLPWEPHHVGGVNQVVLSLAREIATSTDVEPLIGVNRLQHSDAYSNHYEGIEILRFYAPPPVSDRPAVPQVIRYLMLLPLTLLRLSRLLRERRIDVINVHYVNISAINWLVLRRLRLFGGRVILSVHGQDVRNSLQEGRLVSWLWKRLIYGADAIVACSDGLREEIERAYALPAGLICTIHNGIDRETLERTRAEEGAIELPTQRRFIVNVGTFEHKKGHDLLIEAFRLVADDHPDIDLIIIGRDGETFEAIKARVEFSGLASRVFLLRNLTHGQTLNFIARAEFFVLASRNEGFAIVLLEACALSTPVIATNVCGVTELIENDACGRIVPPDDAPALAAAIQAFLDEPAAAEVMGKRGYALVCNCFTWRDRTREYLTIAGIAH